MSKQTHFTIEELSHIDRRKLPGDGGDRFNRLIFEQSPYLLQHATNPIDWHPWSEASLAIAVRQDKPVFLSIGYSTCHWCHVMADESFNDATVAEIINRAFIPIKVDREERPDIDSTYMHACQAMTGHGGWPLTLLLTPGLKPFFAATYIPKQGRHGMTGLIELLERAEALWPTERDSIDSTGDKVHGVLKRSTDPPPSRGSTNTDLLDLASRDYAQQYDPLYGGFGSAPKFPVPHNLSLLFRIASRRKEPDLAEPALHTLKQIRFGGIYDQLGGGIHRYSVDERWLVPHFEKMLYDQALLVLAAVDAFQYSGDGFYKSMALDISDYILTNLTDPEGGFYCGEDADSEGAEGMFYLWSEEELNKLFDDEERVDVSRFFGCKAGGNFEGRNIFHLPEGLDDERLAEYRRRLLPIRQARPRPHLDDKVITSWNGLTISALARLGAISGRPILVESASRCAAFIESNLMSKEGRLLRRWRHGESAIPAFLEDYACLAVGLIDLFQASCDTRHLEQALFFTGELVRLFSDSQGGLCDSGKDSKEILVRGRNLQDGAFPSGNGMAATALVRIGLLTGREDLLKRGEELLKRNRGWIEQAPSAFANSLTALGLLEGPSASLVLAINGERPEAMLGAVRAAFRPRLEFLAFQAGNKSLEEAAPITTGKTTQKNQATAWLCSHRGCHAPTTSPDALAKLLADF